MRCHILVCLDGPNFKNKAQYNTSSTCLSRANIWNEIHYRRVVDISDNIYYGKFMHKMENINGFGNFAIKEFLIQIRNTHTLITNPTCCYLQKYVVSQ